MPGRSQNLIFKIQFNYSWGITMTQRCFNIFRSPGKFYIFFSAGNEKCSVGRHGVNNTCKGASFFNDSNLGACYFTKSNTSKLFFWHFCLMFTSEITRICAFFNTRNYQPICYCRCWSCQKSRHSKSLVSRQEKENFCWHTKGYHLTLA